MNPERWQKLDELFHAASELEPNLRGHFLAEACTGDEALREELESMLVHHEQAKSFIESPAYEVAAATLIDDDPLKELTGNALGSYEILSQLGQGGMGVVYLARDKKLRRKVALKTLPADLTSDEQRVQRFQQEARAASALNHPNILTIFEIGEIGNQHFIATEFVEGVTLRELLEPGTGAVCRSGAGVSPVNHAQDARATSKPRQNLEPGRLDLAKVLDVATQIASALGAAHAAGIVHRDIKPENVMLRPDGFIKVLDFGLAKLLEQAEDTLNPPTQVDTDPGMIIGTLQYMSPEQVRRLQVDARTDIWSLGVVLYEMLAGESPFKAATEGDTIASILHRKPSFTWRLPEAPPEVEWILKKALAKERDERYQTVRDLLIDLKRLSRELELNLQLEGDGLAGPDGRGNRGHAIPAIKHPEAGTSKKSGRTSTNSGRTIQPSGRVRSRKAINSLAIMPLVNASDDPNAEYLSDGITESIINNLSQLPKLRVMARSTVFRYKGQEVDPCVVGRELGVRAVLTGRVLQVGDSLVIKTELVHVADGSQLWGQHYNRKLGDIFAVQEEIARQISEKLQMRLSGEEVKRLNKRHTEDPDAYQLYLQGRYHWNKRDKQGAEKGIDYFNRAIAVDPQYALAYSGLADSFIILAFQGLLAASEAMPQARAAARQALEIDDTVAEAHISLAYVTWAYDWDWFCAEREYKLALELNPNYATAHHWYGEYLAIVGRFAEAIAELERAHEIDPLSLIINAALGLVLYLARQYDRAIEQGQRTLELDANFVHAHFLLGLAFVQKVMFDQAIEQFLKVATYPEGNLPALAELGHAYAISGNTSEARRLLERLREQSQVRYVPPYQMALVCAGLGDNDQAFEWLAKSYEQHDLGLVWLKVEPTVDSLRADPRLEKLLRRIGFPR